MKQTRNNKLYKEFWFHTEPILIDTMYPKHRQCKYIITFCGLYSELKQEFRIGISLCNLTSEKNYNRKLGNEIAYGRAIKRPIVLYSSAGKLPLKERYEQFMGDCNYLLEQPRMLFDALWTKSMIALY